MPDVGSRRASLSPSFRSRRPRVLLFTDPGPDPDDVKALLVLWYMHTEDSVELAGVVCNGGGDPRARAALARGVLDTLGATAIPVAIGSVGVPYAAMAHEYNLPRYADPRSIPLEHADDLIARVLRDSTPRSLTLVCISSLRDVVDAIMHDPGLVRDRVCRVAIMGGLVASPTSRYGYVPDTAVNNEFDREAATYLYDWCFEHAVPMSVVSRHAVPMLSMQLARSFADKLQCPIMRYLANAQFLGLEGLWEKLCAGKLPARCDKPWFFEMFCGVDRAAFDVRQLDALGVGDSIAPYLNGFVKPYDVVAVLAALPTTIRLFDVARAGVVVRGACGVFATHLLVIGAEHMLDIRHVQSILRETFHAVVLATADAPVRSQNARLRGSGVNGLTRTTVGWGGAAMRNDDGLLELDACARLLVRAQYEFRLHERVISGKLAALWGLCASALLAVSVLTIWGRVNPHQPVDGDVAPFFVSGLLLMAIGTLRLDDTNRWPFRGVYGLIALGIGLFATDEVLVGSIVRPRSIARICTGSAQAVLAGVLALRCRLVESDRARAQRLAWHACGCHFAIRATQLFIERTSSAPIEIALIVEQAVLAAFVAWHRSLVLVSGGMRALITRLSGRLCGVAAAASSVPLGLTALVDADFGAHAASTEHFIADVQSRLRGVLATQSTMATLCLDMVTQPLERWRRPWRHRRSLSQVLPGPISLRRTSIAPTGPAVEYDTYVIHAPCDNAVQRASALAQWADAFQRAHHERPRIWIDALCADAARSAEERLADMPFAMGRARSLLLLCGPDTLTSLRCAVELYVWLATGGTLDAVEIATLGPIDANHLVACFDSYHVMYTKRRGEHPADIEPLMRVVERARVSVFNETIRSYLPVVRRHSRRRAASDVVVV